MTGNKLHEHFLRLHTAYEKKAVQILIREFRKIGRKILFDNLTPDNARYLIALNLSTDDIKNALFRIHWTIGQSYGNLEMQRAKREEAEILQEKRAPSYPLFNQAFRRFLLAYYATQGGEFISLLTDTYIESVVKEIRKAEFEGETLIQMRNRIQRTVNSPTFYKWQALRIARTETTFAMNAAKDHVPRNPRLTYDKVWSTAIDGRERESHRIANGQIVPIDEPFQVGDHQMQRPGDRTNASAREVINCRCSFHRIVRRDENGRIIIN